MMTKAKVTAIKGYYDWCVIESLLYPHHNAISVYRVCQHLDIVVKDHHLQGDIGSSINRIKNNVKDETVEIGITTTRDLFIIMNNYFNDYATRTLS